MNKRAITRRAIAHVKAKLGAPEFQVKDKACPVWSKCSLVQRCLDCRFLLLLHGYLTHAEARKVLKRIWKREQKEANKKGRVIARLV